MNPHVVEWLNLTFRWLHVIVGVAWIGASFYFVWLENNLERGKPGLGEGIAGDLWAIHGGGFYYLKKYEVAPAELPETLHWFKWEAYATWLTGITLMTIVYYLNADVYMVDKAVADISSAAAIGIGVGALVVGWTVYDVLCRTPLLKYPTMMLVVMFAFLTGSAWLLSQYLAPRAAYIHVGAMIGSMMAGNVLMVIIPGQRRLVEAAERGEEPDAWQGIYAGLRSRHNNYFTLPVLFIMISNHFSSTWGNEWGWLVLAGIAAAGIAVRHHFNVRHKTNRWAWTMPAAALALVGLAYFTAPADPGAERAAALEEHAPVQYSDVKAIIATRCLPCHSKTPTDDVFTAPPNGVVFDTDDDVARYADRMKVRAYDLQTMPLTNKTNITDDERLTLGAWVHQGAKMP
jgi:uncharacterized membrane protein